MGGQRVLACRRAKATQAQLGVTTVRYIFLLYNYCTFFACRLWECMTGTRVRYVAGLGASREPRLPLQLFLSSSYYDVGAYDWPLRPSGYLQLGDVWPCVTELTKPVKTCKAVNSP